jgi:alpha-mannosidase
MADNADPWGSTIRRFRDQIGVFHLLSDEDGQRFSGVQNPALPSVRVIEDGPVRTVIEAVLGYHDSFICQRYKLPKKGTEMEVEVRVHWNEKDRFLKLSLPTPDYSAKYIGQVAYGVASLPDNGDEAVAQKWVAVVSEKRKIALTVANDGSYGSDFCYGELRLSLLRSPAYSALPLENRPMLPQDRYSPRIDQGERLFRFWLNAGPSEKRLQRIDREALAHNEQPMALSFFPEGGTGSPASFITLSDAVVQITAIKKTETGDDLIIRLFEPTGQSRTTVVSLPFASMEKEIPLQGFEIRTVQVDVQKRTWTEVNLVEE